MAKILIQNVEIVTDGPDYPKKYIGITDQKSPISEKPNRQATKMPI